MDDEDARDNQQEQPQEQQHHQQLPIVSSGDHDDAVRVLAKHAEMPRVRTAPPVKTRNDAADAPPKDLRHCFASGKHAGSLFFNNLIVEEGVASMSHTERGKATKRKLAAVRKRAAEKVCRLEADLRRRKDCEERLGGEVLRVRQQLRKRLKLQNSMTRVQVRADRDREMKIGALEAVDPERSLPVRPKLLTASEEASQLRSTARSDRLMFDYHWSSIAAANADRLKENKAAEQASKAEARRVLVSNLDLQSREIRRDRRMRTLEKLHERDASDTAYLQFTQEQRQEAAQRRQAQRQQLAAYKQAEEKVRQRRLADLERTRSEEARANRQTMYSIAEEQRREWEQKKQLSKEWKELLEERLVQKRSQAEPVASPTCFVKSEAPPQATYFARRDALEQAALEQYKQRQQQLAERDALEADVVRQADVARELDEARRKQAVVTRNRDQASALSEQLRVKKQLAERAVSRERRLDASIGEYLRAQDERSSCLDHQRQLDHMKAVMTLDLQRDMGRSKAMRGLQIKIK